MANTDNCGRTLKVRTGGSKSPGIIRLLKVEAKVGKILHINLEKGERNCEKVLENYVYVFGLWRFAADETCP
ncbi:MAG: hypothetical protein MSR29_14725, partial [Lachnospiraceae bacterium]|nr:hypothetical protein [Lachnospiraceae bacterium]